MAKTRVALEITEESVRAVEVLSGRTPTLIAAGEVALPEGAARDSEIVDRDAVAVALRRLWADAGIKAREVVLGVGSRRILVREHSSPLREIAQVRQALPFEVQDRLPVPVDQAVLDFVPTAVDDNGTHGLLVAAVSEQMEDLVATLADAKLVAESIDLIAFGYARALAQLAPKGGTGLLIGIGEHTTQVVVATDGVPRFARAIPIDLPRTVETPAVPLAHATPTPVTVPGEIAAVPPHDIDESLQSRSGLRRARSATMTPPTGVMMAERPIETDALPPELQTALIDLVTRLRGTVAFYRDRPESTPIDATFITGLHTTHPRLQAALSQVSGTEVVAITANDLMRTKTPLDDALAPRVTATVSMLLGGMK